MNARLPQKQWVKKVIKWESVLEGGRKEMQKRSRTAMLGNIPWCMYLLGAWFKKKSVPKENNEIFTFWLTKALMLFHSMRAASFLRKTSAVPSGYFCFCSERENGKWEKENEVPLTRKQCARSNSFRYRKAKGQNSIQSPSVLCLFVGVFYHLIFYLLFIAFFLLKYCALQ